MRCSATPAGASGRVSVPGGWTAVTVPTSRSVSSRTTMPSCTAKIGNESLDVPGCMTQGFPLLIGGETWRSRPRIMGNARRMTTQIAPVDQATALLRLGQELKRAGYRFTTVTPATHERVNRRPGNATAGTLRDVFGWTRPVADGVVPAEMMDLLRAADGVRRDGDLWRSRVRFSSYDD